MLSRWAWVPLLAVLLAILILGPLDLRTTWGPSWLSLVMSGIVFIGATLVSTVFGVQAYMRSSTRIALALGCGMLTFGLATIAGSLLVALGETAKGVAVHNTLAFLAGTIFLGCSFYTGIWRRPRKPRAQHYFKAGGAIAACVLGAAAITWLAATEHVPTFITPLGPTHLRTAVLTVTVMQFLFASAAFAVLDRYARVVLLKWYWLGLALIGAGLLAVAMAMPATPLSWLGRVAQALGQLYLVVGLLQHVLRSSDSPVLTLGQVFERLHGALSESEERFHSAFTSNVVALAIWDVQGNLLDANDRFLELIGYTREQFEAGEVQWNEATPPEMRQRDSDAAAELMAGREIKPYEKEFVRPDGTRVPVIIGGNMLPGTSKEVGIAFAVDITERKRAEDVWKRTQSMLERTEELADTGGWEWDITQGSLVWSKQVYAIFGEKSDSYVPDVDSFHAHVHPDDRRRLQEVLDRALCEGAPYDLEFRVTRPGLPDRWAHSRGAIILDHEGHPCRMSGAIVDITEKRTAQDSLRRSEAQLRSLAENVPAVLQRFDRQLRVTWLSSAAEKVHGIPTEEFIGKTNREMGMPEPLCELWEAAMNEVLDTGQPGDIEFAFEGLEGPRTFLLRLAPEFGAGGKVESVLGVSTDITERKRAEEVLRESEEKYRQVVQNTTACIFRLNPDLTITFVNDRALGFFGYSEGELIGKHVVGTILPQREATGRDLAQMADEVAGDPDRFQCNVNENMCKDGSRVWMEWTNTGIYDDQGNLKEFLAIGMDVTDRVLASQAMSDLEAHKLDFYRRTLLAATEGKLLICEAQEIDKAVGVPSASWEVSGKESFETARHGIGQTARDAGMIEERVLEFLGCVTEALTNVVKHADGGRASIHANCERLTCVVRDSGQGIAAMALPDVALTKGYSTAGTLGLGYKLMIHLADRVMLATGSAGTTVAVEMKIRESTEARLDALSSQLSGWTSDGE